MGMSSQEVQQQVMTYLEATECTILEKSPVHVTVKLSPQADRQLTNRPYYWGFVERVGVEPETLSFTFVFDPEKYDAMQATASVKAAPAQDSILSRYFNAPTLPTLGPGRIQREDITYGCGRLQQIWTASRQEGSTVYLFEQPPELQRGTLFSAAYEPWLGVCFKVELACDVKKEELHMLGISLVTGQIIDQFMTVLNSRKLGPRLPENIHIKPSQLNLTEATSQLESYLIKQLSALDYGWAEAARERLNEELSVIDAYYENLLNEQDEEKKALIQEQYDKRRGEMNWQYEPKINITAITCGLFHLRF